MAQLLLGCRVAPHVAKLEVILVHTEFQHIAGATFLFAIHNWLGDSIGFLLGLLALLLLGCSLSCRHLSRFTPILVTCGYKGSRSTGT